MKNEYRLMVYAVSFALLALAVDLAFGETGLTQNRDFPYTTRAWTTQQIAVRSFTVVCFVILGAVAARMLARQRQVEGELRDSREQLRNLAEYLQEMQEVERTRIAREVHDQLGQVLTALKMDLSWLSKRLSPGNGVLLERAKMMSGLVDHAVHTVQTVCAELRPGVLDDFGLAAAIEWQTTEFRKHAEVDAEMRLDDGADTGKDLATAVFRIYQETLTNIARHSGATRLSVTLEHTPDRLILTVKDNGKGISDTAMASPRSFGLVGMRERAHCFGGCVNISGFPGKGTTVVASFPINGNGGRVRQPRESKGLHGRLQPARIA